MKTMTIGFAPVRTILPQLQFESLQLLLLLAQVVLYHPAVIGPVGEEYLDIAGLGEISTYKNRNPEREMRRACERNRQSTYTSWFP